MGCAQSSDTDDPQSGRSRKSRRNKRKEARLQAAAQTTAAADGAGATGVTFDDTIVPDGALDGGGNGGGEGSLRGTRKSSSLRRKRGDEPNPLQPPSAHEAHEEAPVSMGAVKITAPSRSQAPSEGVSLGAPLPAAAVMMPGAAASSGAGGDDDDDMSAQPAEDLPTARTMTNDGSDAYPISSGPDGRRISNKTDASAASAAMPRSAVATPNTAGPTNAAGSPNGVGTHQGLSPFQRAQQQQEQQRQQYKQQQQQQQQQQQHLLVSDSDGGEGDEGRRHSSGRFTITNARSGSGAGPENTRRVSAATPGQRQQQPMSTGLSDSGGSLSDYRHGSLMVAARSGENGTPHGTHFVGPGGEGSDDEGFRRGSAHTNGTPAGSLFAGSQFSRAVVRPLGASGPAHQQAATGDVYHNANGAPIVPLDNANHYAQPPRNDSTSSSVVRGQVTGSGAGLMRPGSARTASRSSAGGGGVRGCNTMAGVLPPLSAHALSLQFQHGHATVNREGFRRRREIVLAYMKPTTLDRVRAWVDCSDHGEGALGPLTNPSNQAMSMAKDTRLSHGGIRFAPPQPYPVLIRNADPSLPEEILAAFALSRPPGMSSSASSNNSSNRASTRRVVAAAPRQE